MPSSKIPKVLGSLAGLASLTAFAPVDPVTRRDGTAGRTGSVEESGRSTPRVMSEATSLFTSRQEIGKIASMAAASLPRAESTLGLMAKALAQDVAPLMKNNYGALDGIMRDVLQMSQGFNRLARPGA